MMMNQVYLIKLLVGFFYIMFASQLSANESAAHVENTSLANASLKLVQPISSSNCIVEIKITGITNRPLFINKLPQGPTLKMTLVGSDGKRCPLTKKGEDYYSEKSWPMHASSGILVWLKKDEPISIKMDLAEFFQLKAGDWALEMSIPMSQIREEGTPGQEGGWIEFKDIKIEIPESKKE